MHACRWWSTWRDSVTALSLEQRQNPELLGWRSLHANGEDGTQPTHTSARPRIGQCRADYLSRPETWRKVSLPKELAGIRIETPANLLRMNERVGTKPRPFQQHGHPAID